MTRLLIVEDQPSDLQIAADIARSLNFTEIEGRVSATTAKLYLDSILDGNQAKPDVIILDLDLGYESGHELLRFWHSHPALSCIPMIVWTALGKEQQELCQLFNVNAVVAKWEGATALKRALEPFTKSSI
jgi:CheY-like chemotaxis protein